MVPGTATRLSSLPSALASNSTTSDSPLARTTPPASASPVVRAFFVSLTGQNAIAHNLAKFQNDNVILDRKVNNAALVAMDAHTGEILALVGSADYFDSSIHGAIDMATASRQPGSAFKPFIYAVALDPQQAAPWTAATPRTRCRSAPRPS